MLKITNTEHFGLQRKIVANMTSESWQNIPHVTYNYEADMTGILTELKKINLQRKKEDKITVNTLMLKVIAEGLKAAPAMNAHLDYNSFLVRGRIDTFEEINISIPMVMSDGRMMTVNVRGFEKMGLDEISEKIKDVRRRMENTILEEAMYEASFANTINELKKGKILKAAGRLFGAKTGKHRIRLLSGEEKRSYYSISEEDRLTGYDIEQGTVTVSNLGSLDRNLTGSVSLLEIIPPQVAAFGIGAIQDKVICETDSCGVKSADFRKILPICIAFDHRALDFGDVIPFIKRCNQIFENPVIIRNWLDDNKNLRVLQDA
ncbi:MAG: 2-oxo acid dehydrogenase subunit E2 [Clostridia bacterium]|nr:2-oxo acid dehydrogenase subunit E2 [Clostridia bacterium]